MSGKRFPIFDYDETADVLYVQFRRRTRQGCRYGENVDGDVLWFDKQTGRLVGTTITSFRKRCERADTPSGASAQKA